MEKIIKKDGEALKNVRLSAAVIGLFLNFALFLTKLYIGISSCSLTIYCDAVNNLGDTFACGIAIFGFYMIKKLGETPSQRAQSLCTFVISLLIAGTGIYFVYNGIERMMYPLPVQYSLKYLAVISVTVGVKALMGLMFRAFDKKSESPVLKALALDSLLDCFITLAAVMSLVLVSKINYAVDGLFAIVTGSIISASAIKNIIRETKYLINN